MAVIYENLNFAKHSHQTNARLKKQICLEIHQKKQKINHFGSYPKALYSV